MLKVGWFVKIYGEFLPKISVSKKAKDGMVVLNLNRKFDTLLWY